MSIAGVDPLWLALAHYKRRQYTKSGELCETMLAQHPKDQAALLLQCRARSGAVGLSTGDQCELEEEGVADLMLDDHIVSSNPRPGTSQTAVRPGTTAGADRPTTGFARPGTASRRPTIENRKDLTTALAKRQATAKPLTSLGREVRLGTASGQALGGLVLNKNFDNEQQLLSALVRNPAMAKAACDYLLLYERNPAKALELCTEALKEEQANGTIGTSWWWKHRQGRCYYQLGLFRDAERSFSSSLKDQPMEATVLELAKVYLRVDQPTSALKVLQEALGEDQMPSSVRLTLWVARVHEFVEAFDLSIETFKRVVRLDASHVEGLACLASSYFYAGYPEMSLRYYRRLLQMGVSGPEIWNNVGLCCFYSAQFDMALGCFARALQLVDDIPDVWYNISHVGIGIGDRDFANQSLKVALSLDDEHAESLTNLGVLSVRDQDAAGALAYFAAARKHSPDLFHSFFNGALVAHKLGKLKEASSLVSKAAEINPSHVDSIDLKRALQRVFHVN